MTFKQFEQQVQSAQRRWKSIQQTVQEASNPSPELQAEIITELAIALEELRVATETLQQQNEELYLARQDAERLSQHYQDLFEFAPDGYLVTDERGIIHEANHVAASLLNVRKKYLVNKPLDIFVAQADKEIFNSYWSQIKQTLDKNLLKINNNNPPKNLIKNWETLLQPRDKEPLPVAISMSISANFEEHSIRLYWLLRDISEAKQAQEKIYEQAALLDATTDAILVQNLQDQIVYWNRGAEQLYGWTKEEAHLKNLNLLLSPESLYKLPEIYQNLFKKNRWEGEIYQLTKSGKEIIVDSRWSLVRDEKTTSNLSLLSILMSL